MSFIHLFKYGLSLPPRVAFAKAFAMARKNLAGTWRAWADEGKSTYSPLHAVDLSSLGSDQQFRPLAISSRDYSFMDSLVEKSLNHDFDLLGSGWTNLDRLENALAIVPSKGNSARAREIASLIGETYRHIDWHQDFRSGYRWSANQRSEAILYGHEPGVDIKVPWELARLHHLPQLALASLAGRQQGNDPAQSNPYFIEFKNQVLDFVSANPPGFGVNWVCTMDVAIRAANLIMAFDLFRAQKIELDTAFVDPFVAAIKDHGIHIVGNLEWQEGFKGNHYYADITGLLFVASFLPRTPETDCWLAFAVQEFIHETKLQFLPDGGNAEASTNYHRLSAEMAVYGTALILGLSKDNQNALQDYECQYWSKDPSLNAGPINWHETRGPFSQDHFDHLRRMAQFTSDVTKPDGHVVQIGDTDNGRFFKFSPAVMPDGIAEDHLDHRHLLASIGGLLNDTSLIAQAGPKHKIESNIIGCMSAGNSSTANLPNDNPFIDDLPDNENSGPADLCHQLTIRTPIDNLTNGAKAISYPAFGLFIWRSKTFFLSVRCGPVGQGGRGGHAHNDQLSIEMQINGQDWIRDPGSFVYTSDTKMRDKYRSHLAHAGPRLDLNEPSRLNLGLFHLQDNTKARCLLFNETEFLGVHYGYKKPTYRHIKLDAQNIVITDSVGSWNPDTEVSSETTIDTAESLRDHFGTPVPFSRGYGLSD